MSITLGQLRNYASSQAAPNVSSAAGDTKVTTWINGALSRVWTEHPWRWALSVGAVQLLPKETGTGLTVTEGSRALALTGSEIFKVKYRDDPWSLAVTGEDSKAFEIDEILSPTSARLKADQLWTSDSDTGVAYSWSRTRYKLPDAREVMLAESVADGFRLAFLEPHRFDRARWGLETDRAGPVCFTFRRGEIEVWPGPSDYEEIRLSYRRAAPVYLKEHGDTDLVDWPDPMRLLLERAVLLEAAIHMGKNAVADYGKARGEYEALLSKFKAEDSGAAELAGPMRLSMNRPGFQGFGSRPIQA